MLSRQLFVTVIKLKTNKWKLDDNGDNVTICSMNPVPAQLCWPGITE